MKFNDKELESKARQEAALQTLHDENKRLGLYDYEIGFIDGMLKQAQSSVDKAVNAMTQSTWVGLTKDEIETLSYKAEGNTWKAIEMAEAKLKEKNT
jgi:hypothetical protein